MSLFYLGLVITKKSRTIGLEKDMDAFHNGNGLGITIQEGRSSANCQLAPVSAPVVLCQCIAFGRANALWGIL